MAAPLHHLDSAPVLIAAVAAAPQTAGAWVAAHRRSVIGIIAALAIVAAVAVATYRPDGLVDRLSPAANRAAQQVGAGVQAAAQSVADLLEGRSPGERAEGVLAMLKGRKLPTALHSRALPKVRHPAGAVAPTAVNPAVAPPAAATPLFNAVTGTPGPAIVPAEVVPGTPVVPPPPTIITPGPPGLIVPPIVNVPPVTPPPPPPPPPPAVPEPTTWAMMLMGFLFMGWSVRRARAVAAKA